MTLVFATNNPNKLIEVKALLPQYNVLGLKDIGCFEDIPETEVTIKGNALLKANYVFNKYKYTCFADDTGLEVEALNGEPGVYSARYAGPECNSEANIAKLLNALHGKSNRNAAFKTVVAYVSDTTTKTFEGLCEGVILEQKHGQHGFGYDPVFKPLGFEKSFAEMTLDEKSKISHRGKAIKAFTNFLNQ